MLVLTVQGPLGTALAITNLHEQESRAERALEEFYQRHGRGWSVRLSDDRQRVTSLVGKGTGPYRGKSSEMGLQFLRENYRLFGLRAELDDLRVIAEKASRVGANVEFQQVLKGLPVENGRIQINLDKEGRVVQVVSSYAPIEGAPEEATISKAKATETAINEFLRTTPHLPSKREQQIRRRDITQISRAELQLKEPPKVDDVFFARQERPRRAYKIFINALRPFGIKEFVTDANRGEVLQTRNFVFNAVGNPRIKVLQTSAPTSAACGGVGLSVPWLVF